MKFSLIFEILSSLFLVICILMTLGLLVCCVIEHGQNEDILLCFHAFRYEEKLIQMGTNVSEYYKFITGELDNENLSRIDYDKVSLELEDYLIMKTLISYEKNQSMSLDNITEFGSPTPYKCFMFTLPSRNKIKNIQIITFISKQY